jgi:hypothetical protein
MCDHIAPQAGQHWTSGDYIKICSEKRLNLDLWARERWGAFPRPCTNCEP